MAAATEVVGRAEEERVVVGRAEEEMEAEMEAAVRVVGMGVGATEGVGRRRGGWWGGRRRRRWRVGWWGRRRRRRWR